MKSIRAKEPVSKPISALPSVAIANLHDCLDLRFFEIRLQQPTLHPLARHDSIDINRTNWLSHRPWFGDHVLLGDGHVRQVDAKLGMAMLDHRSGGWVDLGGTRRDCEPSLARLTEGQASNVCPTLGAQEGTARSEHFGCMCYHSMFVFNRIHHCERCALRPGNVNRADEWQTVLKPVIARYIVCYLMWFFRAESAFAIPELYKTPETAGYFFAIRLRANRVL